MAWEFASGEILTAANLNAVTKPNNAVCQVSMSAVQSISNNSNTAVSFGVEDYDVLGWHAAGTPTLITPSIAGWYRVNVDFDWATDGDYTRRLVEVQKNGSAFTPVCRHDAGSGNVATGVYTATLSSRLIEMNGSSDTLRVVAFQTNTSAGANDFRAVFTVALVIPT